MYTRLKEFKAIIKPYNYTCYIHNCILTGKSLLITHKKIIVCYIDSELISTKSKEWLINLTKEISEKRGLKQDVFIKELHFILDGELRKRKIKRLLK